MPDLKESPMDDDHNMGEFWRDVKAARQQKRAGNRVDSADMLKAADIKFEARNDGAHLIVRALGRQFDFWPGTGLWIERGKPTRHYGVRKLIAVCVPCDSKAGCAESRQGINSDGPEISALAPAKPTSTSKAPNA